MELKPYLEYKDTGVDWLPIIPKEWKILPNRSIFTERIKKNNNSSEELLSVTIKEGVIPQKDFLSNSSKKDSSNEDKSNYKLVKEGDLAYNKMRMWQGAIGASKYQGIVSPAYIVLKPRNGINSWYYHFLFRTPMYTKESRRFSYGICDDQLSLRYYDFKLMTSPIPSPNEQKFIIDFINTKTNQISKYIELKQSLINLLEEQKKAIINQAITRGLGHNAKLKPSGLKWLGNIPRHWNLVKIAHLTTKITNGYVGPTRDIMREYGVPYIQGIHIKNNSIVFTPNGPYYVSKQWSNEHSKSILKKDDVLVVQTGSIGEVGIVSEESDGANCHALIILRMNPKLGIGKYLLYTLSSRFGYDSLFFIKTGDILFHLNCTKIRNVFLPNPPVNEQKEIVEYIEKTIKPIKNTIKQIQYINNICLEYQTKLISDVVTGKICVGGKNAN